MIHIHDLLFVTDLKPPFLTSAVTVAEANYTICFSVHMLLKQFKLKSTYTSIEYYLWFDGCGSFFCNLWLQDLPFNTPSKR